MSSCSSAAGSSDPDANADLYKVARLVGDGRGFAVVEAAFVSLASPSVPEALDRCRRLGARRMAVVPYFLFTGVLVDRIGDQARAWAGAQPEVEVDRRPLPRAGGPRWPTSCSSAITRRWPARRS